METAALRTSNPWNKGILVGQKRPLQHQVGEGRRDRRLRRRTGRSAVFLRS